VSITKRFMDVARSNLNSLLEKAAEAADPRRKLANVSDAELEAELARRRAARAEEQRINEARAKVDGAGAAPAGEKKAASTGGAAPPDREAREKAAREREARVRAAREAREREAQRQQQQQQQRQQQRPSGGGGAGPRPGQNHRPPPRGADAPVAQYYARLELPVGASWAEVKSAYRRLMRKYHPDMHSGSPEKLKAATEVAQALTQAYNELEKHLMGGPNRK
jgi:hypothetical protein